jgi:hypothetical protein
LRAPDEDVDGRAKPGHDDKRGPSPSLKLSILAPMKLRLWTTPSAGRLEQFGIAKAPPLLGVPAATPPGGFQGRAPTGGSSS